MRIDCPTCGKEVLFAPSRYVGNWLLIEPEPHPNGNIRIYPDDTWLALPTEPSKKVNKKEGAVLYMPHLHL